MEDYSDNHIIVGFHEFFPDLLSKINILFTSRMKIISELIYKRDITILNKMIIDKIPEWEILASFYSNKIVIHTYKVLFSLQKDPDFSDLSVYNQNVLCWACLLHDIGKRGPPLIKGKDYSHPFKGGHLCLLILEKLGIAKIEKKNIDLWNKVFENAYIEFQPNKFINNNKCLPEIYEVLNICLGDDKFCKDIVILVILHQSLPTLKRFTYPSTFESVYKEVSLYFTPNLLDLMQFLAIHDSLSYLILWKWWKIEEYKNEFKEIYKNIKSNLKWI